MVCLRARGHRHRGNEPSQVDMAVSLLKSAWGNKQCLCLPGTWTRVVNSAALLPRPSRHPVGPGTQGICVLGSRAVLLGLEVCECKLGRVRLTVCSLVLPSSVYFVCLRVCPPRPAPPRPYVMIYYDFWWRAVWFLGPLVCPSLLQNSSSSASSEASETCQAVSECSSPTSVSSGSTMGAWVSSEKVTAQGPPPVHSCREPDTQRYPRSGPFWGKGGSSPGLCPKDRGEEGLWECGGMKAPSWAGRACFPPRPLAAPLMPSAAKSPCQRLCALLPLACDSPHPPWSGICS